MSGFHFISEPQERNQEFILKSVEGIIIKF